MADAFERAVGALAHRERTVAELESWLEHEVPAGEIAETIDRLLSIGELDDERFARRYAEDKRSWSAGVREESGPRSPRRGSSDT